MIYFMVICYIMDGTPIRYLRSSMQDLETINMEDFRHNYVNLTGFRLVRYEEPVVRDAVDQMRRYEHYSRNRLLNTSTLIKV